MLDPIDKFRGMKWRGEVGSWTAARCCCSSTDSSNSEGFGAIGRIVTSSIAVTGGSIGAEPVTAVFAPAGGEVRARRTGLRARPGLMPDT